jgi:hypothetical protein
LVNTGEPGQPLRSATNKPINKLTNQQINLALYTLNIIHWLEQHQLPCYFKQLTHIDCPGCGMQRSFLLLIKGDLAASFKMYPALIPVILLFLLLVLHMTGKVKNGTAILKYSYFFCAGVILLSYIYKLVVTKTI